MLENIPSTELINLGIIIMLGVNARIFALILAEVITKHWLKSTKLSTYQLIGDIGTLIIAVLTTLLVFQLDFL